MASRVREFTCGVARRFSRRAFLVTLVATIAANQLWLLGTIPQGIATPLARWGMLVSDLVCGLCLLVAVKVADEAVARGRKRLASYAWAVVAAGVLGAFLSRWAVDGLSLPAMLGYSEYWIRIMQPAAVFLNVTMYGGLAVFMYVSLASAREAEAGRHEADLARAQARRATLQSRLQAMQARVEPQFLFHTLAQVRRMFESDPMLARRMLEDLIAYLRAALPQLRQTHSDLKSEIALVRAYLDILQVRLGGRLAFVIEVSAPVPKVEMPPMMLLPLIQHALSRLEESKESRMRLRIVVERAAATLRCVLHDDGNAFDPKSVTIEITYVAERLHVLFGGRGSLRLGALAEGGTQATLEIPDAIG